MVLGDAATVIIVTAIAIFVIVAGRDKKGV
jgi:hypothetical protein